MDNCPGVYVLEFSSGIYIGSSVRVRRRILRHIADLKRGDHSNGFLQASFNKHGISGCRVLVVCGESDLLLYEQAAIDALCPRFNLSPTAGRNTGHKHSSETVERMRAASKAAWVRRDRSVGLEQRMRISASLTGRQFSAETRAKISASKTGQVKSEATRQKISDSKAGKKIKQTSHPHTPESLAKILATRSANAMLWEGR